MSDSTAQEAWSGSCTLLELALARLLAVPQLESTGESGLPGEALLRTTLCQATQSRVAGPDHCPYWEAALS